MCLHEKFHIFIFTSSLINAVKLKDNETSRGCHNEFLHSAKQLLQLIFLEALFQYIIPGSYTEWR